MRLLLFTEEPILARGIESVLASAPELQLISICASNNELLGAMESWDPDLLLLDFTPEENFSTLLDIRNRFPDCRVVLWVHRISVEVAYQAMRLGVRGILRKTLGGELLIKCLGKVAAGEYWFEKELTASFLAAKTVALTPREGQLVGLVAEGLKNKEIATSLSIAEATVRIYLSALFRKLGVKDRYELAIYGMKNMASAQLSSTDMLEDAAGERSGRGPQLRYLVMEKPLAKPVKAEREGTAGNVQKVRVAGC